MSKLLTPEEFSEAITTCDGMDPGTHEQAVALDAIVEHAKELTRQLARAHQAIAVLYVGKAARGPDGKVDIERVIRACLGEPS